MYNKHTAGDWYSHDGQIYPLNLPENSKSITIAVIPYYDKENEQHIANEKLLAASKDLLEALQALISLPLSLPSKAPDSVFKRLNDAKEAAKEAINKAIN